MTVGCRQGPVRSDQLTLTAGAPRGSKRCGQLGPDGPVWPGADGAASTGVDDTAVEGAGASGPPLGEAPALLGAGWTVPAAGGGVAVAAGAAGLGGAGGWRGRDGAGWGRGAVRCGRRERVRGRRRRVRSLGSVRDRVADQTRLLERHVGHGRRAPFDRSGSDQARDQTEHEQDQRQREKAPEVRVVVADRQVVVEQPRDPEQREEERGEDEDAGDRADDRPADQLAGLLGDLGLGQFYLFTDQQGRAFGDIGDRGGDVLGDVAPRTATGAAAGARAHSGGSSSNRRRHTRAAAR